MHYLAVIRSEIVLEADTIEDARSEIESVVEDAQERNAGDLEDEILAGCEITDISLNTEP